MFTDEGLSHISVSIFIQIYFEFEIEKSAKFNTIYANNYH